MDISDTLAADSSQVNADDVITPRVVTITGVSKGTPEQPVFIELAEFPGRSYRPCKSMRRVLASCWGTDASQYIGRRMRLFNDPTVKWGGVAVGGIRLDALSHIDKKHTVNLSISRGKRVPFVVEPLPSMPTEITGEQAEDFLAIIEGAQTIADLDSCADVLKTSNLGAHHDAILKAWKSRRDEISAQATE